MSWVIVRDDLFLSESGWSAFGKYASRLTDGQAARIVRLIPDAVAYKVEPGFGSTIPSADIRALGPAMHDEIVRITRSQAERSLSARTRRLPRNVRPAS